MPTWPIRNRQNYLSLHLYLDSAHLESPLIPDYCWGSRKHDYSMLQPHILILIIIHKQHEVVHVITWHSRHITQHHNPFTPPPVTEIFPSTAGIYSDATTASQTMIPVFHLLKPHRRLPPSPKITHNTISSSPKSSMHHNTSFQGEHHNLHSQNGCQFDLWPLPTASPNFSGQELLVPQKTH